MKKQQNIKQFFEEDKKNNKHINKTKILLIIGCVVCAFYVYNFFIKPEEPSKIKRGFKNEIQQDERKNYSEEEIKRFVEFKAKKKKQEKIPIQKTKVRKPNFKRDLSKKIGVYVFKEEKQRIELPRQEEQKAIGISSGTQIRALLTNDIFSFNVETPVIVISNEDYIRSDKVLIPKNTRFLGQASIVKSFDRINVVFQRMVFPDGREVPIQAMALSLNGSGGIQGKVKRYKGERVFKAIAKTLLGGVALFAGSSKDAETLTMQDQLLINAAGNLTNQAQQNLRPVKVDESITVKAYTPIQILFLEAV